jgi:hypothetical protein
MISRIVTASTLVLPLFLASAADAANLIRNGGFEMPVVPDGGFVLFSTGQKFPHWTVVGASGNVAPISGTFTQGGFNFVAKKGKQFIDLTGTSNTATGVRQKVVTSPGQGYSLTFYVGNVVNPSGIFGTSSTVNVLVDGTQIFSATNSKGTGSTTQVWQKFTVTFTATKSKTAIALINGDPASDTANGLDAVSLVPLP